MAALTRTKKQRALVVTAVPLTNRMLCAGGTVVVKVLKEACKKQEEEELIVFNELVIVTVLADNDDDDDVDEDEDEDDNWKWNVVDKYDINISQYNDNVLLAIGCCCITRC